VVIICHEFIFCYLKILFYLKTFLNLFEIFPFRTFIIKDLEKLLLIRISFIIKDLEKLLLIRISFRYAIYL